MAKRKEPRLRWNGNRAAEEEHKAALAAHPPVKKVKPAKPKPKHTFTWKKFMDIEAKEHLDSIGPITTPLPPPAI